MQKAYTIERVKLGDEETIEKELPGFPIVLHGSSSVPQDDVDTINKYGGKMVAAVGIPEEQLRKASKISSM